MKRISKHTVSALNNISDSLNPNCELTRKVVFSLHDCYGLKVLDEYISTYKPRRATLIEKASKLLLLIINWIRNVYNKIKRCSIG